MKDWEYLKKLSETEFSQRFSSPEKCLEFLADQKWKDGFVCRKCGHTHYCNGKTPYARRCTKCKSEESATAHTMFHRCKIHLPDAFRILHTVCSEPGVSSYKLSDDTNLRQMTCWKFKKKVSECLQNKSGFSFIQVKLK
jgi:hypothetical protein